MPARRSLAAGLFAGRAWLFSRRRLRAALRRRPRPEAPRGLAGSEADKRVPGGRLRGDEAAESAGGHRCATAAGEVAAKEDSPASSTGDGSAGRAAQELRQQLTRKQWRNRQKNKRRQKNKFKASDGRLLASSAADDPLDEQGGPTPDSEVPGRQTSSLRQRLESRLEAARFRYINQLLYTRSSQEAAQLFQEDPEALGVYHRGFALQAAHWPERPVERFVHYLHRRPASLVVADFGCGDCTLARSLPNRVHCFDLAALDPRVTVCDMAQVPLEDASVDVAVFCLALMGTNLREILQEAHRVLRAGGTLLVAEVASRFADLRAFLGALARLGFRLTSKVGRLGQPLLHLRAAQDRPGGDGESGRAPRTGAAALPVQAPVTSGFPTNKGPSCWRVAVPVWLSGKCRRGGCRAQARGSGPIAAAAAMSGSGGGRIDVNRAGAAELERALVGIGHRRARGIVRKREELRGFARLEDLLRVKGITARILELNRQRVTCSHRPETPDRPPATAPRPRRPGLSPPRQGGRGATQPRPPFLFTGWRRRRSGRTARGSCRCP
ncbi:ribosomal RNA-processing protein 8 isoform X2 [Pseudonaja textilis]|uniref:ribosomal RNA-processing protein 8 isoform X2 n=1 Tax=Pseudonaja textilis TaxID=8673 RepID=UPI000EA8ECB0|nr:ribosomal RNA-processing protein 8 isoform X2 [Pseudonaja textilis]